MTYSGINGLSVGVVVAIDDHNTTISTDRGDVGEVIPVQNRLDGNFARFWSQIVITFFRDVVVETSSSSSSDSDDSDDGSVGGFVDAVEDGVDDLDDLGQLVIDESLSTSIVDPVVDINANIEPTKISKVVENSDEGERGRPMTRSRSRAISAPTGGLASTLIQQLSPSGAPPSKRSRSQSRPKQPRSCSPLKLPDPPGPQPTPEMEQAAQDEYMKKVSLMSKAYLAEHANHDCFGSGRPTSLRPLNCVGRGGLSMKSLARWNRGWGNAFASDGGYAEGYFDADDDYYNDPQKLNPSKKQKGVIISAKTDITGSTSSQAGPATAVVPCGTPMEVDNVDNNVVATYKELSPVLRAPRSFENRPRTRLSEDGGRMVKVNIAGVLCNVLDDRDPSTGRMEDRRSQWIIDKNIASAALIDSYEEMSDEEYEIAKAEKKKLKKKKAAAKKTKLEPQRLRAIHANMVDSVTKGDRYIGGQQATIDKAMVKMTDILVRQTKEWTTPRLGGQSRPSLKWIDCVDRVVDIDGGYVGNFSTKDPGFHPIDDITLIRAKVIKIPIFKSAILSLLTLTRLSMSPTIMISSTILFLG